MLTGYKTYIIATLGVIYAIAGFLTGHVDGATAIQLLVTTLGLAGLRSGLNTAVASLAAPRV